MLVAWRRKAGAVAAVTTLAVAAVVLPAIGDSVGTPQTRVSSMHIFAMSIGTP